jgi:hypothetical protein
MTRPSAVRAVSGVMLIERSTFYAPITLLDVDRLTLIMDYLNKLTLIVPELNFSWSARS